MYDNEETLVGLFVGEHRRGYGRARDYAPGENIIRDGDAVDHLVMVLSGTAEVWGALPYGAERRYMAASSIEGEQKTAILGASYFMLRRRSERVYRAASDCLVVKLDAVKVNEMYNDHRSVQIARDLLRNSDPEMMKALEKHLRAEYAARRIPGMDPDRLDEVFRVPRGSDRAAAVLYDRAYRGFAAKIVRAILERRKQAGEERGGSTLVGMPVHRTSPPPAPGSAGRKAWEAGRSR